MLDHGGHYYTLTPLLLCHTQPSGQAEFQAGIEQTLSSVYCLSLSRDTVTSQSTVR